MPPRTEQDGCNRNQPQIEDSKPSMKHIWTAVARKWKFHQSERASKLQNSTVNNSPLFHTIFHDFYSSDTQGRSAAATWPAPALRPRPSPHPRWPRGRRRRVQMRATRATGATGAMRAMRRLERIVGGVTWAYPKEKLAHPRGSWGLSQARVNTNWATK